MRLLGAGLQADADIAADQQKGREPRRQQKGVAGDKEQQGEIDRVAAEAVEPAGHQPGRRARVDADPPRGAEVELRQDQEDEPGEQQCHAKRAGERRQQLRTGGPRRHRRRPASRGDRLPEQQRKEDDDQAIADKLSPIAGAEQHDPPGAVTPVLEPRAPHPGDRDQQRHASQRHQAPDHPPSHSRRNRSLWRKSQ